MKNYLIFFVVTFLSTILPNTKILAQTETSSFRCGNLFVVEGVLGQQVIENCGEPVNTQVTYYLEKWTYGPYAGYMYVVYVREGIVTKVESYKQE